MISTKWILILLLIFAAHENVNSKAGAEHEPKLENLICSVNSRIIELENEIDGMKSSCDSTGDDILSALRSQVDSLQDSFVEENLKVKELEQRMQQMDDKFVTSEDIAELDDSCKDLDIRKHQPKSFLYYLPRINFNIFLNKPSNESSKTLAKNPAYKAEYGINEDFSNYFHSAQENNPWMFVDLKVPHFIWKIEITLREVARAAALKIYVANEIIFDSNGKPDMKYLPVFASQIGASQKLIMSFTHSTGMCGRYVIVAREVLNEHLIFHDLKGIGYSFGQD